jgi:hypothetical protein
MTQPSNHGTIRAKPVEKARLKMAPVVFFQ